MKFNKGQFWLDKNSDLLYKIIKVHKEYKALDATVWLLDDRYTCDDTYSYDVCDDDK